MVDELTYFATTLGAATTTAGLPSSWHEESIDRSIHYTWSSPDLHGNLTGDIKVELEMWPDLLPFHVKVSVYVRDPLTTPPSQPVASSPCSASRP